MLGFGVSSEGEEGGNKSTQEEGAVGKLVGRQQPSSCKIREIKAIMGAAKTRSLRSRSSWGGLFCQDLLGWKSGWVGFGGRQSRGSNGRVGGRVDGDGVARMEGHLLDGRSLASSRNLSRLQKPKPARPRKDAGLLDAASSEPNKTQTGKGGEGCEVR